ncbi:MAG: hypothetical protein ACN4GM_09660 [Gammaproteobacteria bacterium]
MISKYLYVPTLSLFLMACSNQAYFKKEKGSSGGYVDTLNENDIYHIAFYAKAGTQRKAIVSYWHRRASELCLGLNNYHVYTEWNLNGSTIQEMDPSLNGPPYDVKFSYTGNYSNKATEDNSQSNMSDKGRKHLQDNYGIAPAAIVELIDKPLTKILYDNDPIHFIQGYAKCKE